MNKVQKVLERFGKIKEAMIAHQNNMWSGATDASQSTVGSSPEQRPFGFNRPWEDDNANGVLDQDEMPDPDDDFDDINDDDDDEWDED